MKKIIALLLVGITSFSLMACESDEEKEKQKMIEDAKVTKTISIPEDLYILDKFQKEIEKAGNQVGSSKDADYNSIGAQNGYLFSVNGQFVEIYEYNLKNLNDKGKAIIEEAKAGTITKDGKKEKAIYKEGLLLTSIEGHSNEKDIVDIFNKIVK